MVSGPLNHHHSLNPLNPKPGSDDGEWLLSAVCDSVPNLIKMNAHLSLAMERAMHPRLEKGGLPSSGQKYTL